MRLDGIKGKRLLVVVAECSEALGRIMDDPDVAKVLEKRECPEGEDPRQFMLRRVMSAVPAVFGRHADDVIHVLGTIASNTPEGREAGMTVERYEEEGDAIADLMSLLTDGQFLSFLR